RGAPAFPPAPVESVLVFGLPASRERRIRAVLAAVSGDAVRAAAEADRRDGRAEDLSVAALRIPVRQTTADQRRGGVFRSDGVRVVSVRNRLPLLLDDCRYRPV